MSLVRLPKPTPGAIRTVSTKSRSSFEATDSVFNRRDRWCGKGGREALRKLCVQRQQREYCETIKRLQGDRSLGFRCYDLSEPVFRVGAQQKDGKKWKKLVKKAKKDKFPVPGIEPGSRRKLTSDLKATDASRSGGVVR